MIQAFNTNNFNNNNSLQPFTYNMETPIIPVTVKQDPGSIPPGSIPQQPQQPQQQSTKSTHHTPSKNTGTDFVKKLFQMLEENSYARIVRWSDTGDSFIITDTNEFTKDVLPSYFKHSNFASFVRQLNKYDFHKVKISNELKQRYQIENVWEFKHPDFNKNNKASLDNIKRKVPVKKDGNDPNASNRDLVSINQFRNLQDRYDFIEKENSNLTKKIDKMQEELINLSNKYNTMVSGMVANTAINESFTRAIDTIAKSIRQVGIDVPPLDLPFMSPMGPPPPLQQQQPPLQMPTNAVVPAPQQQPLQQQQIPQQAPQQQGVPQRSLSATAQATGPIPSTATQQQQPQPQPQYLPNSPLNTTNGPSPGLVVSPIGNSNRSTTTTSNFNSTTKRATSFG
ncbi:unnamed protein product [Ambrosiozyma monospora]|uniref:Unnamed protein product n=1 Tax=Ambrosiozyma monospora TaxID=43982 RepID=A0ACB5T511_AMBMO|nr:unnamed protein product [Ambrosiozyma monospora]